MSIVIRLGKLRFLVQEIELAAKIARAQPTDYFRRVLSRRVLIRAKDFANHAREFRRPAQRVGYDLSRILRAKEAYAKAFDEYYKDQRDRLCAHVQDIDWARRLELWTDIEASKVDYFVEGAREVYESLAQVGIDEYQPYAPFPEVVDVEFANTLANDASAHAPVSGVTMGVDILAATRPNTTVALNFHPLHQRASQLAAIRDWLSREVKLDASLDGWENARRICRAQIVTDVVSFADCLVTREDAGEFQKLTGLDKLMLDEDPTIATPIDDFIKVFRFGEKLSTLRRVRDRVGAHLHKDENVDLAALVSDLDGLSLVELLRFYDKILMVFVAACRYDDRLRMYQRNNERLFGVFSVHGGEEHVKHFDDRKPGLETHTPAGGRDFTQESITRAIQHWMEGGAEAGEARHYMWTAFEYSATLERCERNGQWFDFRIAHKILLEHLDCSTSSAEVGRILDLTASCANGWPKPLAEVLLRFRDLLRQRGDLRYDGAIYWVLGCLPVGGEDWIDEALLEGARVADARSGRLAIAAFYRRAMALRSGPANREPRRGMYVAQAADLVNSRPQSERLCVLLQLGGLFSGGQVTATQQEIDIEYPIVQAAVAAEALSAIRDTEDKETASIFLKKHDYVSLAVLVCESLQGEGDMRTASDLVDALSAGEIAMAAGYEHRAQPLTNLAVALLHASRLEEAKRVAATVMRSYPSAIDLKLRCLWILARAGHPVGACREMLEYLRASYLLDSDLQKLAKTIDEALVSK